MKPASAIEKNAIEHQRQKLVVIEGNLALQKLTSRILASQTLDIEFASNSADGLALIIAYKPDLILINLTAPGFGGFDICRRIREHSVVPILVMLNEAVDDMTLWDLGVDDYLTVPFSADELRIRLQTLLQDTYTRERLNLSEPVWVGDLQIDFQRQWLARNGRALYLSQIEWRLLELLLQHAGKVVSHNVLHHSIWEDTPYNENSHLGHYIDQLRHKLELDPQNPRYLISISNIGYCFFYDPEQVNESVAAGKLLKYLTPLPTWSTSFIGCAAEITRMKNLLQMPDVHLVSVIGPGGAGKTRLCLQVAGQLIDNFEDGVCYVPLAAVQNADLVTSVIAQVLGMKGEHGSTLEESLKAHLADKNVLLVLDDFEQAIDIVQLVSGLLEAASGLKMLIISRLALQLDRQNVFEMPPLTLPDLRRPSIAEVSKSAAVTLFLERVQPVQPGFTLTLHNVFAVAELCAKLNGLPLAIELVAAQIRGLSPQEITAQISSHFVLLSDEMHNFSKDQQVMRSTLDWVYQRLAPEEKLLFARISIFIAGCTLNAVDAVTGLQGASTVNMNALAQLPLLLSKNILVRETVGEEIRFNMQGVVREYAYERLKTSGELELLAQKHAAYYLALAERAQSALSGPNPEMWLNTIESEQGNMRAALNWALQHESQIGFALRLATVLAPFWKLRGHWSEARHWLETILVRSEMQPAAARAAAFQELARLTLA